MKRATAIIGANYGDEGKGLLTDYICSKLPGHKVVVRFNGGAQAGHTVVTPEGQRHVFSHFGSGSFTGADTYLAKHYVCNPLLFWKEAKALDQLGLRPVVAADPRCHLTTPYDMILNQLVEEARGKARHGSVGVGFGETIERNQYPAFRLCVADIASKDPDKVRDIVREKLRLIRRAWLLVRCRQLRIPQPSERSDLLGDEPLERTLEAFCAFAKAVRVAGAEFLDGKSVVFEGAQGLALDMDRGEFPHVTRSNTGLTNVLPLARACRLPLGVIYATRAYLTRHGAGPLPDERPAWHEAMKDATNIPHPFQGELRYATLGIAAMLERIRQDFASLGGMGSHSIALTCTDQVSPDEVGRINRLLKPSIKYVSAGPTRADVNG